jgi:hypothetical protein
VIIESLQNWFFGLGAQYGVNPLVFGAIYVGAVPFFSLSVGWIVRNYRRGRSILLPTVSALFFFISAYLYLIIAGRNVPWWVYAVVVAMVVAGAYSTVGKIRRRIAEPEASE